MRAYLIIFLFFNSVLYGQDSVRYDKLISYSEGKSVKSKYRSTVTGSNQYIFLKKGEWRYYDDEGSLLKIENYIAYKSKTKHLKDGYEVYLNPVTGDSILIREFSKGQLKRQYAYSSAVLVEHSKILKVYRDFGSYSVYESSNNANNPYRGDFVTVWQSSIEDPDYIRKMDNYSSFEDSIGDPSLLIESAFSTQTEYNYVSNPEFEIHPKAPFSIMSFTDQVEGWIQASESPDLYLSANNAHSGISFIGFRVFSMSKHIEYVQNRLKAPLTKDSVYCFSAYVKLSPGSKYASNAFGIQFTEKANQINTSELLKVQASVALEDQILLYKTRWMKVQCTYKAKGGEQWLTIGSFQNHKTLSLMEVPGVTHESYYYLDDVTLSPVKNVEDCPCNFADQREKPEVAEETVAALEQSLSNLSIGESLILKNINFENDKDDLLPSSFKTLYEVLTVLEQHPTMTIELSGHTSGLGGFDHNLDLSERRAEAVKQFLQLNGIDPERITTVGHGPKFLIASDLTEEGQHTNRRVEIKVLSL